MKKNIKWFTIGALLTAIIMSGLTSYGATVTKKIDVLFNSVTVKVNNKTLTGDNIVYKGNIYIQASKVSDMLGKNFVWDKKKNTVNISDKVSKDIPVTDQSKPKTKTEPPVNPPVIKPFSITSSSFENGKPIPLKNAYDIYGAENKSIGLKWANAPKDTKSFVLLMYDLNPVANEWLHWVVVNIPATVKELQEGISNTKQMPDGAKELSNSYGFDGYGGPCPPSGTGAHEYKVILYALNVDKIETNFSLSAWTLKNALEGKIIEKVELSGYYER